MHFAAEWFNAIGEYAVIDSEPFTAPESGDTISFDITQELNSVFNAGVGIENQFSEEQILIVEEPKFLCAPSLKEVIDLSDAE